MHDLVSETVGIYRVAYRDELGTLSAKLARTFLGIVAPIGLAPLADLVENAYVHFAWPMARHYLLRLQDVAVPEPNLVRVAHEELLRVLSDGRLRDSDELLLDGVSVPDSGLEPRDNVSIRSLSSLERGHYAESRQRLADASPVDDFVVPPAFDLFTPRALLETSRDAGDQLGRQRQLLKLVLAFHLLGWPVATPGVSAHLPRPRWVGFGNSSSPFPLGQIPGVVRPHELTQSDFDEVVHLAGAMPDFGPDERSREEIVLYRTLRGCADPAAGLLDFAIALEGALLASENAELSYRFALYGALFLREEQPPQMSYGKLREVYTVRSKLVHGSRVDPDRRKAANENAQELTLAIVLRAIRHGWPSAADLNVLALQTTHRNQRKEAPH